MLLGGRPRRFGAVTAPATAQCLVRHILIIMTYLWRVRHPALPRQLCGALNRYKNVKIYVHTDTPTKWLQSVHHGDPRRCSGAGPLPPSAIRAGLGRLRRAPLRYTFVLLTVNTLLTHFLCKLLILNRSKTCTRRTLPVPAHSSSEAFSTNSVCSIFSEDTSADSPSIPTR